MLNYLSAEFYKLRFHKGLYIGTGLLLLLEFLVFLPGVMIWEDRAGNYIPQDVLLAFLVSAMSIGIFIVPIFAAMVFDNQNGNGTLKNEIVFGVPRSRIYVGKLAAGAVAGTAIALLAVVFFLLLTFLLGGPPRIAQSIHFSSFLKGIVIQWLIWLSAYAFSFLMLALFHSPATAMVVIYMVTIFSPMFMAVLMEGNNFGFAVKLFASLFFMAPFTLMWMGGSTEGVVLSLLGGNELLYALVICLVWWGLSIGGGLLLLRYREIK